MTKRVLITGAASGLGWELARQYHDLGWYVLLLDRDAERLASCGGRDLGAHTKPTVLT